MSNQEKLENQVQVLFMETGMEPKIIVMHPVTWEYLVTEVIEKFSMNISSGDQNMKYRGCKVLRSLDLKEGEYEIN